MGTLELISQLRNTTGAGMMDCKKALEEADGDMQKAQDILRKKGAVKAAKREGKVAAEGAVASYIHAGGKVGVLLELACETDFVAKTADFQNLAKEVSMQVAAMNPKDVDALLKQEYIRDPKLTISDVVKGVIATLGENIKVKKFQRFEVGTD